MAFLENLSKKASEASAKAIQMTKEFSDTTRLNSMISTEEKNITNTYYQIGKLYVSTHQNDYDEQFGSLISAIRDSEEKIKNYREQIQEIKGIQYCEHCGAEVPKGVAFCSSCGAAMPTVQVMVSADYTLCGKCGEQVKKGMRFCTSCGNPMPVDIPTPAPSVMPQTNQGSYTEPVMADIPAESSDEQPPHQICPNCGTELAPDLAFCIECGTKL